MTTAAHLRKGCLARPEVVQDERSGRRAWAVAGSVFADVEGDVARLDLPADRAATMAAELDGVRIRRGGVELDLAAVDGMALNHWVGEAWRHRAPRRLVDVDDAARASAESGEGDLPPVGRPATRALHGAGLTSLDAVAACPPAEVASLHGVGPAAVRRLREALAERGTDW